MSESGRRFVVDTNVIVSAAWKEGSVPDLALARLLVVGVVLVDARILAEYRDVLARKKLAKIPIERREAILTKLAAAAEVIDPVAPYEGPLPDPDDRVFVEVALAGRAHAIVTGNLRDYPEDLGFEVLPPATVLARLG